jgi:hypothetical protein
MVFYTDYVLEETQYIIYEFNRMMNNAITKAKLDEADIIMRAKEVLCENEVILEGDFIDKIKTNLFGAQTTGRYDLVKEKLIKNVNRLQTPQQVDLIMASIPGGVQYVKNQMETHPEYEKQMKEYIKWLQGDFKIYLKGKKKELQHSIAETGLEWDEYLEMIVQESELGDRIMSHIPGGTLQTGRFDLLRPKLLKLAKKAKDMKRIQYLRKDASIAKRTLQTLKKNKPEFKDQIDSHLKWLDTEYKQALNDRAKEIRNSVNEASFEEISLIQEAAKDTIVKAIDWLINKIKELWAKFFGRKADRDSKAKWLKDNRNAILNNGFKGSKEMPEFWKYDSLNDKVVNSFPKFDYASMKPNLSSDDSFINAYFKDLYQDGKSYVDVLKTKLYGEKNAVLKDGQVPIKNMFDFCTNAYVQKTRALENIHNACVSAAEQFKNDINNGKVKIEESSVVFERYFYSYLMESVIYEADLAKDTQTDQQQTQTTDTKNTNNNTTTNNTPTPDDQKKAEANKSKVENDRAVEAQKLISRYLSITNNIKGTLMKYLEDKFDTYFAVLMQHAKTNGVKTKPEAAKKEDNTEQNNTNKEQQTK